MKSYTDQISFFDMKRKNFKKIDAKEIEYIDFEKMKSNILEIENDLTCKKIVDAINASIKNVPYKKLTYYKIDSINKYYVSLLNFFDIKITVYRNV